MLWMVARCTNCAVSVVGGLLVAVSAVVLVAQFFFFLFLCAFAICALSRCWRSRLVPCSSECVSSRRCPRWVSTAAALCFSSRRLRRAVRLLHCSSLCSGFADLQAVQYSRYESAVSLDCCTLILPFRGRALASWKAFGSSSRSALRSFLT